MFLMTNSIDINCDMGEGMPGDAAITPYISSANIACGYHAGDESIMRKTIELCLKHNVAIGAHPGFDDKENFGRVNHQLSEIALYDLISKQISLLDLLCRDAGATLHHVKPHGALYNMAAKDQQMSRVISKAVKDFNPKLLLYGLSNSYLISEAKALGLATVNEVFADRTYQRDGSLTPRTHENALITNTQQSLAQVMLMIQEQKVKSVTGEMIPMLADTLCLHGDGKYAVSFAKEINDYLKMNGIKIQSPN